MSDGTPQKLIFRERIKSLVVEDLFLQFRPGEIILDKISVSFPFGACVAIYGGDASGKSMLLKTIAGLTPPTSGKVLYNDKDISKMSFEALTPMKLSTTFCFENGGVLMNKSIEENLKISLSYHNQWRSQRSQDLFDALVKDFKLTRFLPLGPAQVSPSVRKVTGIVRSFLVNPQIIFLDEPSLGIGEEAVETLKKWIKIFRGDKADSLLLFCTQDKNFVEAVGARKWTLKDGKLILPETEIDARAV